MPPLRFAAALLCAALTPLHAPAECGAVSDRELKPLVDRVAACAQAKADYEKLAADGVKAQQEWLANLAKAREMLRAEGERIVKGWQAEIPLAQAAIAEIQKRVAGEIEGANKEEKRLRGLGDNYGADLCVKNAKALAKSVEDKTASGFKKELTRLDTIAGFEKLVAQREKEIAALEGQLEKGEFAVAFLKPIGRGASGKEIAKLEEEAKAAIAKIEAGEPVHFLKALGCMAARKDVEKAAGEAQARLDAARAAIRDGEYKVNVQGRGLLSRNDVQRLIAEATAARAAAENAWDSGTMPVKGHIPGTPATLADVEREIRTWTSRSLIDREGPDHDHAEKKLAEAKKLLERLEREKNDAVAAQEKRIAQELTPLLALTPCRGGSLMGEDPDRVVVERQRRTLAGMGETDEESKDRLERHADKVLVEDDFTVHGSLRDALANATEDVAPAPPEPARSLWDQLCAWKDYSDQLSAVNELSRIGKATEEIATLVQALRALDPEAPDYALRAIGLLKDWGPKMAEMFEKGYLSSAVLDRSIAELLTRGTNPEALKALWDLRNRSRLLWHSGLAGLVGRSLPEGAAVAKMLSQTRDAVNGLGGVAAETWNAMSGFDRICIGVTAIGNGAALVGRVKGGMEVGEAVVRSTTDLAVDLAITACPPAAALELASILAWQTTAMLTGDQSWSHAVFSSVLKDCAEKFYDKLIEVSQAAGASGERLLTQEVVQRAKPVRLRRALEVVEARIAALAPGAEEEAPLLRMRERLRRALRL